MEVLSRTESTRLASVQEALSTPAESGILTAADVLPRQPVRDQADPRKFAAPRNPHAPVSADDIADPNVKAYVVRFSKVAKDEMERFGVPASISLAQGLIESRAGTSKLARQNNNHFGIKCFSKNCGKGHCSNHFDDHHKDFFRKFNTPWESWRAHSKMLAEGRYKPLKKYGNDYKQWAHGLQQLGYATDRTYGSKLVDIIERYKLYRYDR
jgi:flagellum-specific peptidoglycan hydrolase FlgJ